MDLHDIEDLIKTHNVVLTSSVVCTTRALYDPLDPGEMELNEAFKNALYARYGEARGRALFFAISVLVDCRKSFKKRMISSVKDNWLTKETFHAIAQECADALGLLTNPREWQIALKQKFESWI